MRSRALRSAPRHDLASRILPSESSPTRRQREGVYGSVSSFGSCRPFPRFSNLQNWSPHFSNARTKSNKLQITLKPKHQIETLNSNSELANVQRLGQAVVPQVPSNVRTNVLPIIHFVV